MKIFISHSSSNADAAKALMEALREMGIPEHSLFFSSNYHAGVGLGNPIAASISSALLNADVVILLLSKNYYDSAYCLNEMGAAWILKKRLIPILIGGLDYNELRGFINSDVVCFNPRTKTSKDLFNTLQKISGCCLRYTNAVDTFLNLAAQPDGTERPLGESNKNSVDLSNAVAHKNIAERILSGMARTEELLLLAYMQDMAAPTLGDRWMKTASISEISEWEHCHGLFPVLSERYDLALRILLVNGWLEVASETSYGNPREYRLTQSIQNQLFNLPNEIQKILDETVLNNRL